MKLHLRLASPSDIPSINRLRLAAYQAASWFTLAEPKNIFVESDPANTQVILATSAGHPDHIVGTVAIQRTECVADLRVALGAAASAVAADRPVLTVIRLAVSKEAQGGGLNHALRRAFIRAAESSDAIGFCSSQAVGTPNIPAMKKLGYQFEEVPSLSQKTVVVQHPTLLVNWLPKASYPEALAKLEQLLTEKQVQAEWVGPALKL